MSSALYILGMVGLRFLDEEDGPESADLRRRTVPPPVPLCVVEHSLGMTPLPVIGSVVDHQSTSSAHPAGGSSAAMDTWRHAIRLREQPVVPLDVINFFLFFIGTP